MSTPVQEDFAATVAKKHPWLRSDPATLTGDPPSTFESLWKTHKGRWEQVFMEWLRGETEGVAHTFLIDQRGNDDEILAEYLEVSQPGTTAVRRQYLNEKWGKGYGNFTAEIGKIQATLDARVKQLQDEAKKKGEKPPSTKEARKQAGNEVGKAAVKQQLAEQKEVLGNINIALVVNLQLKDYQVNALQQYNLALNNLGDAKWDEPDPDDETKSKGPSPEKEDALDALGQSGTAMFQAYGEVSATVAAITSLGPGVEVPKEAVDKLAEDLLVFGQAIAAQSDAMGKAGRLFTQWSMRVSREFIRENFASIYPQAGAGLLALRTLATITGAVSSSIPGYGWIGTVAGAAESAVELAVKSMAAWDASKNPEIRKKYALQKFELDEDHKRDILVLADKTKKGLTDFVDGIQAATVDKVTGKVTNVVDEGLKAAAAKANISSTQYATIKRTAGTAKEVIAIPASVMGVELPEAPSLSDAVSNLATTAIEQAPGGGAIIAAGKIFFDVAEFYAAVHSHLENADGVSDEDVELVRVLIDKPPQHEGFQLFGKGKGVVYEGMDFPVVYLRMGKAQFGLDLKTNLVYITDEKMISDEMLGYAQQWAKKDPNDDRGLRYVGRVYQPDWGSWKLHLDRGVNSPFHVSMKALHKAPDKDYVIDLELSLDLDFEEFAITKSSLKLDPKGLDEKLRHNAYEDAAVPITIDDLSRFVGKEVAVDGKTLTLTRFGERITPAQKAARVAFDMVSVDETKSETTVSLIYVVDQELQVEKVGQIKTAGEVQAEKAAKLDAAMGPSLAKTDALFDQKRGRGETITSEGLASEKKKKKGVGVTVSHLFTGLVKKG